MSDETYKFNIGDVVRLNSGGPAMTVFSRSTPRGSDPDRDLTPDYECEWFSTDNQPVEGTYDERCISAVTGNVAKASDASDEARRVNAGKITHWLATGERMKPLPCPVCSVFAGKYTFEGVCLDCADTETPN